MILYKNKIFLLYKTVVKDFLQICWKKEDFCMDNILCYRFCPTSLPSVKYISQTSLTPPQIHVRRRTEEFILYYILSGRMYIGEGDRRFVLDQNEMLILDPQEEHYGTAPSDCSYFYVHFYFPTMEAFSCSPKQEEDFRASLVQTRLAAQKTDECSIRSLPQEPVFVPKHLSLSAPGISAECIGLLERIQASHYNRMEHFQLMTSLLFAELLLSFSRAMTDSFFYRETSLTSRSSRIISDILSYLQTEYRQRITGSMIEQKFGCNYDYVNRLFKKAVGHTILDYLNRLRISHARQYLSVGGCSLSEIAERCGFENIYYFSRVFKKYTGTAPGAYARASLFPGNEAVKASKTEP